MLRLLKVLGLTIIALFLLSQCKKKEDYTEVRKDLEILKKNWKPAGENLRATIAEFKEQMTVYRKSQMDLKKLAESKTIKNQAIKNEASQLLDNATKELDSLKIQLDSLNAYSKKWSEQSKRLNALITDVKEEKLPTAQCTQTIAELRQFKALADPKLEAIRQNMEAYKPRHEKVKAFTGKYIVKK